jgi:hypothetical protein
VGLEYPIVVSAHSSVFVDDAAEDWVSADWGVDLQRGGCGRGGVSVAGVLGVAGDH